MTDTPKRQDPGKAYEGVLAAMAAEPASLAEIQDDYELGLWAGYARRAAFIAATTLWRRGVDGRLTDLEDRVGDLEHPERPER